MSASSFPSLQSDSTFVSTRVPDSLEKAPAPVTTGPGTALPSDSDQSNDLGTKRTLSISLTLLTTLLFLVTTTIVAFSILILLRLSGELTDTHTIGVYLHIFVYCALAVASLAGIYFYAPRATTSTPQKVSMFSFLISTFASLLLLSLAVSAFGFFLLFQNNPSQGPSGTCNPDHLAQAHDDVVLVNLCQRSMTFKALSLTFIMCSWLLQLAVVPLGSMYAQRIKLQQRDAYNRNSLSYYDDAAYWDSR